MVISPLPYGINENTRGTVIRNSCFSSQGDSSGGPVESENSYSHPEIMRKHSLLCQQRLYGETASLLVPPSCLRPSCLLKWAQRKPAKMEGLNKIQIFITWKKTKKSLVIWRTKKYQLEWKKDKSKEWQINYNYLTKI